MEELSVLAIIPARSGSKGLPGKNIINCAGRPLISWSIVAAIESKYITRVVVTTDSEEIAEVAKEYGAWVPFLRKPDLAKNDSSITDVINDVISNIKNQFRYDLVILLQPTSPLRTSIHIDEAIDLYIKKKTDSSDTLVSLYEVDSKCLYAFGIKKDSGNMYSHFGVDLKNLRRQNLPKCYVPNGAIYIATMNFFAGFYTENTIPFIMNKDASIDIDSLDDLEKASAVLSKKM